MQGRGRRDGRRVACTPTGALLIQGSFLATFAWNQAFRRSCSYSPLSGRILIDLRMVDRGDTAYDSGR